MQWRMFAPFLGYFVRIRYQIFKYLEHQVVTRIHFERTIEAIYVYWFTTGSVRSGLITVETDSGNPCSGKLWLFWIAAIAEAKCSWNLISVVILPNRGSPVGWTCRWSQNCRWRVKSTLVIVTSCRSVGVSIVHGQNRKTGSNWSYSKKYQCSLGSFPSSWVIIQWFVRFPAQNLPKFDFC